MPDSYAVLADIYDWLHASVVADIDWLLTQAAHTGGPILELGCGTGRLLLPLARAGWPVTGVDRSAEMLALARRQLAQEPETVQQRVSWLEADMLTLALPTAAYALAVLGYNTVMHIPPAHLPDLLRRLARALRAGGRLIIDTTNPFWLAEVEDSAEFEPEDPLYDPVRRRTLAAASRTRLDPDRQCVTIEWRYTLSQPDQPDQRLAVRETYHYLWPHTWQLALSEAGFRLLSLGGDYSGAPLTEDAPRLLLIAETA